MVVKVLKKLTEYIYYRSPVCIQNLAVSIYGFFLWRNRYSSQASEKLNFLKITEKYSGHELLRLQEKLFVDLARHAINTVPFYTKWASEKNIKDHDITSLSDLKLFPIITKNNIRAHPKDFVSTDYKSKNLISLNTSGTTGSPLKIWCDKKCRTQHYAFFSRLRSWFGVGARSKRATFFGRIILKADQDIPPFWRYDIAQKNLIFSSYHLSDKNIHLYYKKLRSYQPDEIIGYPSSLHQVALYVLNSKSEPLNPKLVICTAENLLDYQREIISKAFNAPIVNQYGCTEMAFFASECEQAKMHFHPEHGIFEVLNENGEEVFGKPGHFIATGLLNNAMPLIRYDTGDIIQVAEEQLGCGCGRSFPVIEKIEGRSDDLLYRLDGTPVGRLDPVFKKFGSIVEAKITQNHVGNISVELVPGSCFGDDDEYLLTYELKKRVGEGISIEFIKVDSIPREKNGKFKSVVGNFKPQ